MEGIFISQITPKELEQLIRHQLDQALETKNNPTPHYDPNKRFTIKEICEKYNISKPTVHKHMHKGLPYEKLGRKTLFRCEEAEAYFRSKSRGTSS